MPSMEPVFERLVGSVGRGARLARSPVPRECAVTRSTFLEPAFARPTILEATLARPTVREATLARSTVAESRPAIPVAPSPPVSWLAATLGKGQQRQMPRPLDRRCQRSLVLGARACLAPWLDHAAIGYEAAHAGHVLVVNVPDSVRAESAHLPA